MTHTLVSEDRFAALPAESACPRTYSTADVARLFGATPAWVYWVLRGGVTRSDGSLIEPERVGAGRRRRFTRADIEDVAVALHYRGTLSHDGAVRVIAGLDEPATPAT